MPDTYTVTLPTPARVLSPNARGHWRAVASAKKAARRTAFVLVLEQTPDRHGWAKARTTIRWFTKTRMHPDPDNALASCKAYFDGAKDAGLLLDDRDLAHDPIVFGVDKDNPRVEITYTRS